MMEHEILCPQCRTALKVERKANGVFWACAQCAGMALNLAVLRRCLPPDRVKAFWRHLQTGSPTARPCPSCAQSLQTFTHRVEQQTLALDVCKTCQVVWFDRGEFDALPTKALPSEQTENLSPEAREELALLKLQAHQDVRRQAGIEANKATYWAETAIGVVYLLIRMALRA